MKTKANAIHKSEIDVLNKIDIQSICHYFTPGTSDLDIC